MKRRLFLGAIAAGLLAGAAPAGAQNLDPENTLYLQTKFGRTVIQLRPDLAPNHVARVKQLAREKFYDGIPFHRVIAGFMAQTGDPTGTGTGGSDRPDLRAEFSLTPYERGVVGMARSSHPHSANSQFFITYKRSTFLNGKYTVFGQVVSGMEHIDRLRKGAQGSGTVRNPDQMLSLRVAADVK
ncbi:MAG: peptidylprolyl isomerase [Pseudomonadota bacterium]